MEKIIKIAIDGHSSCGKSTLAKDLAKHLGLLYIDSGAMYRAIALYAIRLGIFEKQETNFQLLLNDLDNIEIEFKKNKNSNIELILNGENVEKEIRLLGVSSKASLIAALPQVREQMVNLQRKMALNKSVIMDGRDIGTVVFPNAEVKLFITASAEIRAKRRFDELKQKGENIDFDSVYKNITERDFIDQNREISPLKMAKDAILIDNSNLNPKQQLDLAVQIIKEKLNEGRN